MLENLVFRNLGGWQGLGREAKAALIDKARYQTFKAGRNARFLWVFAAMAALAIAGSFAIYGAFAPTSLLGTALASGAIGGTAGYLGFLLARLLTLVSIKKEVARLLAEADKTKP